MRFEGGVWRRGWLSLGVTAAVTVAVLALGSATWAGPGAAPLNQTVPPRPTRGTVPGPVPVPGDSGSSSGGSAALVTPVVPAMPAVDLTATAAAVTPAATRGLGAAPAPPSPSPAGEAPAAARTRPAAEARATVGDEDGDAGAAPPSTATVDSAARDARDARNPGEVETPPGARGTAGVALMWCLGPVLGLLLVATGMVLCRRGRDSE